MTDVVGTGTVQSSEIAVSMLGGGATDEGWVNLSCCGIFVMDTAAERVSVSKQLDNKLFGLNIRPLPLLHCSLGQTKSTDWSNLQWLLEVLAPHPVLLRPSVLEYE